MQKIRGPTHKGGAKAPTWNWELDLYLGGDVASGKNEGIKDTVKFSIYEEDVTSSELVGETEEIPVKSLVEEDKKTLKVHEINH